MEVFLSFDDHKMDLKKIYYIIKFKNSNIFKYKTVIFYFVKNYYNFITFNPVSSK